MRDSAVRVLSGRFSELTERAKRRQLTGGERSEVDRLGVIIDTLQGMAAESDA